jgi:hypothetical protein
LQTSLGTLYNTNAYTKNPWNQQGDSVTNSSSTSTLANQNQNTATEEDDNMPGLITSFDEQMQAIQTKKEKLLTKTQVDNKKKPTSWHFNDKKDTNKLEDTQPETSTKTSRWNIVATPLENNSKINIKEVVAALLLNMQKSDCTTKILAIAKTNNNKISSHKEVLHKRINMEEFIEYPRVNTRNKLMFKISIE